MRRRGKRNSRKTDYRRVNIMRRRGKRNSRKTDYRRVNIMRRRGKRNSRKRGRRLKEGRKRRRRRLREQSGSVVDELIDEQIFNGYIDELFEIAPTIANIVEGAAFEHPPVVEADNYYVKLYGKTSGVQARVGDTSRDVANFDLLQQPIEWRDIPKEELLNLEDFLFGRL